MFDQLSSQLSPWATQPVDFRQLMTDLSNWKKIRSIVAGRRWLIPFKTLRVPLSPRSASWRRPSTTTTGTPTFAGSFGQLLQKMMPSETFEARPVRQRILGPTPAAAARPDQLEGTLDSRSGCLASGMGVEGDMESDTRSSKGPAPSIKRRLPRSQRAKLAHGSDGHQG